ncbi:hypothetical protein HWV62_36543 [Athelia sp. TMB]|nr:hypothetical protein HWV62_36543 [Athelia sp. TMB]
MDGIMNTNIAHPYCGVVTHMFANEEYSIETSPVRTLLYSNLPPTTAGQSNATRQTLQEAQRHLRDVDENIRYLLAKRMMLQNYIETHRGIVSSLRQVPNEILSEVFIHALPVFPFRLSQNQAPLLFERVCKRWKDVSRSTPTLWSYISLSDYAYNIGAVERDLRYTSTCLARSGNCPLSISLDIGAIPLNSITNYLEHPALAMLTAHSERWHRLILQAPWEVVRKLEILKGRLSLLSSMNLEIRGLAEQHDATEFDVFAFSPKLRHLELSSEFYTLDVGMFSIPWKGLTSLVLSHRQTDIVWGILLDCPCLVVLEVTINTDNNAPVQDVNLQYLRSLSLTLPSSSTMLFTLVLPALVHASFMIETPDEDIEWAEPWHIHSGLDTMLSQSRCTLLQLELWDDADHLEEWDFVCCLEAVPSLHGVVLCPKLSSMLLSYALFPDGAISETFLPNLKDLVLWASGAMPNNWPHDYDLFLRSFRALTGHFRLIQSLTITMDEEALAVCEELYILVALRVLRSEGIYVNVVDDDGSVRPLITSQLEDFPLLNGRHVRRL